MPIMRVGIDIVSARETIAQRLKRQAFSDDRDPSQFLKTKAMERVIKQFYIKPKKLKIIAGMLVLCVL